MKQGRAAIVAVGLVAVIVALAACSAVQLFTSKRTDQQTYTVGATTNLVVQTFNGAINVTAGPDATASVTVTSRGTGNSQAEADSDLAKVAVSINQSGDTITVTAKRTDQPNATNSGADVTVSLPRASSLQLTTSNGRVEAVNVTGSITVRTSNGDVTTRQGSGIDVQTSNGAVTAANPTGSLSLQTSNGSVDVLGATDVTATVQTSNGHIAFNGSLAAAQQTFGTSNAGLTLQLPSAASFSIDAHTSNGTVRTDFPLTTTKDGLSGQVGTGGATIHASTSNGDLSVTKLVQ